MKEERQMGLEYRDKVLLGCAGLLALGLMSGGYLLGDGLKRAKAADRSVTVRGLAERNQLCSDGLRPACGAGGDRQ
jgi:hypothetical protein